VVAAELESTGVAIGVAATVTYGVPETKLDEYGASSTLCGPEVLGAQI